VNVRSFSPLPEFFSFSAAAPVSMNHAVVVGGCHCAAKKVPPRKEEGTTIKGEMIISDYFH